MSEAEVCRCSFCLAMLRGIENAQRNAAERRKMLTIVKPVRRKAA